MTLTKRKEADLEMLRFALGVQRMDKINTQYIRAQIERFKLKR